MTPAQSVCNYGTLLFRNAASLFSVGDGIGTGQRFLVMSSPGGPNNETSPSSRPANKAGNETNPEARIQMPTSSTRTPTRTRPRRASLRANAKRATRTTAKGKLQIGHSPGNQGIKTQDQIPEQLRGG